MPEPKPSTSSSVGQSGVFLTEDPASEQVLRQRAEREAARTTADDVPEDLSGLTADAARKMLHELRVQQIELQIQNEELRRAQYELEASRARYFDLYDLAPVGYLTIGAKGLVLEANLTAAGLLDVPRSALVSQRWTQFVFPADQDVYAAHRKQLSLSGGPQVCELRLVKSNGQPFWVRLEARVTPSAEGGPSHRTVLSDISERKLAEQAQQASEARHRVLFQNSPDALMTLSPPRWQLSSGNAAAVAMLGAHDELDFLAQMLWQCSPERQPDGRLSEEKTAEMIDLALRHGTHGFGWTFQRASGETFNASVLLVRMEVTGVPLLQATVRDETEAQRQRGILAQTERLASMGMLAASVGHEINNPLASVLSNLEILTRTLPRTTNAAARCRAALHDALGEVAFRATLAEDAALLEPERFDDVKLCADEALEGTRRITRISKVLSTFSRADALEMSNVDVHYAIDCAITMAFNEVRFRATLDKDLKPVPGVWASAGKLSQVFLNLLVNAAHAMDDGDIEDHRITIRAWAEGASVFVSVEDTGNGITPENMARIFEPFFSTKNVGAGSGLGLSICRSIVAEIGGEIGVESEAGQGTRVLVRLPASTGAPRTRQVEPRAPAPQLPALGRILVIEDEDMLRTIMKRLLSIHEVITVSSGKEAQALLERDEDFDLILCDLMMPGVTGVDFHRWLLKRSPTLAGRVMFVTGGAFGPVTAAYLADSGVPKIDKPFENAVFEHIVGERVREVTSDRPRAPSTPPRGSGK